MGLLTLLFATINAIDDTIKKKKSAYWEYDYDNYFNLCTMLEEQENDEEEYE